MNAPVPRYFLFARVILVAFGCAALAWGIHVFPVFWQQSIIESMARRIIANEPFKNETLSTQLSVMEAAQNASTCRPDALRSVAIIRLRVAEDAASSADRSVLDAKMEQARAAIRASLACSPADPFLWIAVYWIDKFRDGFRVEQLDELRMSYRLGPNEGWIAIKRNPVVFEIFDELPTDLADYAIREFARILETGLKDTAWKS
jgi:hypothetical protein